MKRRITGNHIALFSTSVALIVVAVNLFLDGFDRVNGITFIAIFAMFISTLVMFLAERAKNKADKEKPNR